MLTERALYGKASNPYVTSSGAHVHQIGADVHKQREIFPEFRCLLYQERQSFFSLEMAGIAWYIAYMNFFDWDMLSSYAKIELFTFAFSWTLIKKLCLKDLLDERHFEREL
ncbi:hypothetical protein LMG28614_03696 [Paraburkholderia ultramafica]|uniref:Uncharacterized protein n=1 Tax=Paraburkholderia ultramafica TaxID=1544867 RepID=A0A6S7D167_9BURK|nr:hypothetical protein LMG28614_03696 [Paraburkholderia ultramafica]